MNKLFKYLAGLCAVGFLAGSSQASSVVQIDLTGSGGPFDFDAAAGSIDDLGATLGLPALDGLGVDLAAGANFGFNPVINATAPSLGVNSLETSGDATSQIDGVFGESLTFSFDFSGTLSAIDFEGLLVNEAIQLTTSSATFVLLTSDANLSTVTLRNGIAPSIPPVFVSTFADQIFQADGLDDVFTGLNIPFAAGETLAFSALAVDPDFFGPATAAGNATFGFTSIDIEVIPSPSALGVGCLGAFALLRSRSLRTRSFTRLG